MAKKSSRSGKSSSPKISAHVDKDSSVSVRQIENGFIVAESGTKGKGRNTQYYSKEYFSKANPVKINSSSSGPKMRFGSK